MWLECRRTLTENRIQKWKFGEQREKKEKIFFQELKNRENPPSHKRKIYIFSLQHKNTFGEGGSSKANTLNSCEKGKTKRGKNVFQKYFEAESSVADNQRAHLDLADVVCRLFVLLPARQLPSVHFHGREGKFRSHNEGSLRQCQQYIECKR